MNKKEERKHVKGRYVDMGSYQKKPLSLMSKGEKIKDLLPSIPKGENVEYGCH